MFPVCVQVIKTLDPKQQPVPSTPDVQALKNQLTEKERKIQHLEVRPSDTKRLKWVTAAALCKSH